MELNVIIDDVNYNVITHDVDYTIFQFCSEQGINIPCYCYHEKLDIAGNRRMCLVHLNEQENLVLSCTTPLTDGLIIYTHSDKVIASRRSVMEFLSAIIH